MNNLEKEIEQAIINHEHGLTSDVIPDYAKAAASVAMKWIEKAFCDAYIIGVHDGSIAEKKHNYNNIGPNYSKENWLKENGLAPTEPDTKESTEDAYWKSYLDEPVVVSNGIADPG